MKNNKKGLWRLSTSVFVLVVIWQLVFFQCLAPLFWLKAVAEDSTQTIQDDDSSSAEDAEESSNKDEEDSDKKVDEEKIETETPDESKAEEEKADETETTADEQTADENAAGTVSGESSDSTETEAVATEGENPNPPADNIAEDAGTASQEETAGEEMNCEIDICPTETINNNNDAEIANEAVSDSTTGENSINPPAGENETIADENEDNDEDGENSEEAEDENAPCGEENNTPPPPCGGVDPCPAADIATGNAASQADIFNEANTNIISENSDEIIENINGTVTGDINLLEIFENLLANAENLGDDDGSAEELEVLIINNNNTANVTNNATASSNTGANNIESDGGTAGIETGDALAIANIVNMLNTNIVGNNWILALINIYGSWIGNLIVPGEGVLTVPESSPASSIEVNNTNTADIENNANVSAMTGENSLSGAVLSSITTGDAQATGIVQNIVNTNIVKNNWFFLLINNAGSWIGKVLGWNNDEGAYQEYYSYDFDTYDGGNSGTLADIIGINNSNSANVTNNATASANTGGNSIAGASNASIETGNASAWVNIFNFINTNIVGNNWIFAVVNNFGNWTGDVVFEYPDLAVSISEDRDPVSPGNDLAYTITYKNEGGAKCDGVKAMLVLPADTTFVSDSIGGSDNQGGGSYSWNMDGLKPGETRSFSVKISVNKEISPDVTSFESVVGVATETAEQETGNNVASVSTNLVFPKINVSDGDMENPDSSLSIKRETNANGGLQAGNTVKHSILISNSGDTDVYNLVVSDKIVDPAGAELGTLYWPVDEIKSGKKILVEYELLINSAAEPGTYTYTASAEGTDPYNDEVKTKKVSTVLRVLGLAPTAYAQGEPSEIAGAEAAGIPEEVVVLAQTALPIWMLLAALLAYFLTINWSLIRKNRISR
jgi:uncharacterized repeat protein (TIGR01451 family)